MAVLLVFLIMIIIKLGPIILIFYNHVMIPLHWMIKSGAMHPGKNNNKIHLLFGENNYVAGIQVS